MPGAVNEGKPTIDPCPFCGEAFGLQPPNKPTMAVHPGQQADGSCALAGFVFHGERMKLLNKRPETNLERLQDSADAADRGEGESLAGLSDKERREKLSRQASDE